MSVSRLGSVAAVLGGVAWIVAAVLAWGEGEPSGALHDAGFALLVVALAALGYALVATAPVWLRVLVAAATPALGTMVWLIVEGVIAQAYVAAAIGGVLLLLGGGIGLTRSSGPEASVRPAHRGRRAAR